MIFSSTGLGRAEINEETELVLVITISFFSLNHGLVVNARKEQLRTHGSMSNGLKLPAAPNTAALAVIAASSEDVQAASTKAPNNQLPVIIILFLASCIGRGVI
jgi:hypothetical protein